MNWKKLDGFYYEVSDCGKVRSIARVTMRSNGKKHTVVSKVLKPATDGGGYSRVALMQNGKLITKKIHRVVAECFIGQSEKEVNHINGIKSDNNISNLEYVTRGQNMRHAFASGLCVPAKGSDNSNSKIDEIMALTIKTMLMSGFGPIKIAKMYGISKNITKDISRNKTWRHISV